MLDLNKLSQLRLSTLLAVLAGSSCLMLAAFSPLLQRISSVLLPSSLAAMSTSSATPDKLYSVAFVTVPNEEVAKKLAGKIVSGKLAACVNILPGVTSVYEWEGKIENDSELLLMIKTRTDLVNDLAAFVRANHPYDVPEVIATPIEGGSRPYLDWIGKTATAKAGSIE